jgi:hypothetical protein
MAIGRTNLTVKIEGLRFRSGDRVTADWQAGIVKQRLSGQGVLRLRSGDSQADLARFLGMRQSLDFKVDLIDSTPIAAVGPQKTAFAEMIDHPELSFKVAREVISGSLLKGRRMAAEINEQTPGRKVRIPTEEELLKLNELLGEQLEGNHLLIWTETEHEAFPGQFVLRHQFSGSRNYFYPGGGYGNDAVRFVEDK